MKGVSLKRINGEVVLVNAVDEYGNGMPYPIDQYVAKGYEPDYTMLPEEISQSGAVAGVA